MVAVFDFVVAHLHVYSVLVITIILQHTAPHCTTLHHTATHCNIRQNEPCMFAVFYFVVAHLQKYGAFVVIINTLKRGVFEALVDTLPHTDTHCNKLQHTKSLYLLAHLLGFHQMISLQHTLQHTATHCNTLQHTATHCSTLQHTGHCNTLQHTAIHCNTVQHSPMNCDTLLAL